MIPKAAGTAALHTARVGGVDIVIPTLSYSSDLCDPDYQYPFTSYTGKRKGPPIPKTRRVFTKKKQGHRATSNTSTTSANHANVATSSNAATSSNHATSANAANKLKDLKPAQLLRKARDLLTSQDKYRSTIAQLKEQVKLANQQIISLQKTIEATSKDHDSNIANSLEGCEHRVSALVSIHNEQMHKKTIELKNLSAQALADRKASNRVSNSVF